MENETNADLSALLVRLRQGDEEAADAIWKHCFERLKEFARTKLSSLAGRSTDEEDIALSAIGSFMVRYGNDPSEDRNDPDGLWKLLFTVTLRNVVKHSPRESATPRGQQLCETDIASTNSGDGLLNRIADDAPITSVELIDHLDKMATLNHTLIDLPENLRTIAIYRLSGDNHGEIAVKLGCSTRTVERKLELIRQLWIEDDALE